MAPPLPGGVPGQAGSPLPRQLTFEFQSSNIPRGFGRQIQAWRS